MSEVKASWESTVFKEMEVSSCKTWTQIQHWSILEQVYLLLCYDLASCFFLYLLRYQKIAFFVI